MPLRPFASWRNLGILKDRLNFVTDPELERMGGLLAERLGVMADELEPGEFRSWATPVVKDALGLSFDAAGASEGTLWLADPARERLVPVHNDGPDAQRLLNGVTVPLSEGLIGMVFATQQSFCENEVYKNVQHSKEVDRQLEQVTCAMIAVPLYFAGDVRGVISCVRLRAAGSRDADPPGFGVQDLGKIELAAEVARSLIEQQLVSECLGVDPAG